MKRDFSKSAPGKNSPSAIDNPKVPAQTVSLSDAVRNLKITSGTSPKSTVSEPRKKDDTTSTPGSLVYEQERAQNPQIPSYPPFLVTTFPPKDVGTRLADYPDGWCECLFASPELKEAVFEIGLPLPVERPPELRHQIKESKLGGLGVFATVDMKFGDLVLSERPLLLSSGHVPDIPVIMECTATTQDIDAAVVNEWEAWHRTALDRMEPEARAAYLALVNYHQDMGPVNGRAFSNAFKLMSGVAGPLEEYGGVHDITSRINHSCIPSVTVRFNQKTFASEVRVVRSIKAGEEILVSYVNTSWSREERQERLIRHFNFECGCAICVEPDAIALRERLQTSTNSLDPLYTNGLIDPYTKPKKGVNYRAMFNNSVKWMDIIEKAGMQESELYSKHLSVAANASFMLKDRNLIYPQKRVDWVNVVNGP